MGVAGMGLLSKANPKATWRSVVRKAVATSATATSLYALVLWWNRWWDKWPVKLGICAALMLLVAGLWEWQVPDSEGDEQGTERDSTLAR